MVMEKEFKSWCFKRFLCSVIQAVAMAVALDAGTMLCRIVLWDCFRGRILTESPAKL